MFIISNPGIIFLLEQRVAFNNPAIKQEMFRCVPYTIYQPPYSKASLEFNAKKSRASHSISATTCADFKDFAVFNEVYAQYFTGKPARSCVAVKDLPKGVLCEIEAVAVMKQ